jgi:hypothetical protein
MSARFVDDFSRFDVRRAFAYRCLLFLAATPGIQM